MIKYRILERLREGNWKPFGVAYERDGRVALFAPPWRADRSLAAATLEELDQRHYPGVGFQWRSVETTPAPVQHPIELLRRVLEGEEEGDGIPEPEDPAEVSPPEAAFRPGFVVEALERLSPRDRAILRSLAPETI
jgi:hypothetical protein